MEEVINILWSGPFNLSEISRLNYQELPNLFTSPAYGKTLVYIGKGKGANFSDSDCAGEMGDGAITIRAPSKSIQADQSE